jgi:hypothetical protein
MRSCKGRGDRWSNMRLHTLFASLTVLLCTTFPTRGAELWYQDNNLGRAGGIPADFVEKFRRPGSFARATRYINVYMLRTNIISRLDDSFFTELFVPYLRTNNIRLALNSGAATWTRASDRRQRVFDNNIDVLRRLKRLDVPVDYISLQSILSKPYRGEGETGNRDYPMAQRIEDAVIFAQAAREIFPTVKIGIMDALPSHAKDYRAPYRQLKDALDKAGIGLSYVHLDIPFDIPASRRRGVTWQSLRDVERYVEEELGIAFGILAKSRWGGQRSARMYYERTLSTLECFAGSGGTPREYVVTSNFSYPETTIPETASGDDYPHMRTVLAFGSRLNEIKRSQEALDSDWRRYCGIN